MSGQRVEIPGSSPKHDASAHWSAAANTAEQLDATIILRRPAHSAGLEQELLSGQYRPGPRESAEQALAADPKDLDAVRAFAAEHHLSIVSESPVSRTVMVRGTASAMTEAFGVQLGKWTDAKGRSFVSYQGPLSVPAEVSGVITAVLGLDQRPVAGPR